MSDKTKRASVLLDMDDTILDFHKAESVALTRTLEELGIEPKPETLARYSEINKRQWELLEEGILTREQVLVRRYELLFQELGINCSGAEATRRYESHLAIGHWFMPGAEEMLEALFGKCDLYIVSNGSGAVQAARIKSAGIEKYFRKIFISEELGADKPSREFFNRCFAAAPEIAREHCVIVGDSLTSDIRGGLWAGIKTCWYNPGAKAARADIPADYEIRDLAELAPLLREVFPV